MLRALLDLLFPPQCGACGTTGSGICERCLPHASRVAFRLTTLHGVALGAYDGELRRAVLALKSGRRDVAEAFAQRLSALVTEGDVVVPVPTTAARRRERGFDGCELIAREIAKRTQATAACGLIQTAGDRQRGRNRVSRLSAKGRFRWRGDALAGQRVVLLDDVATTGATLEDCARVLRGAGATVERAVVVARA